MHSGLQNSRSHVPSLTTQPTGTRATNLSRRLSSSNQISGLLSTSGSKDYRLNFSHVDYNTDSDNARITMKTRVAVRGKTPHRFQVVPLRDVSQLAATLEGGRPSQLALPVASHTLIRSASIRRQTYSQVRPVIASSYSQLDLNTVTQDTHGVILLADCETLASPSPEMLGTPVLALSPYFELENVGGSNALEEQDMNRQNTQSRKFESSIMTPTNAQKPVALFLDRGPSIHSTSQSLDLATYNSQTYPKVSKKNAPKYLISNAQSSVMNSKSPHKKRTRSENITSIRDDNRRDDNGSATKENYDFRRTKRHAIYTQSLYVPFLESPSYFSESSTQNQKGHHQLLGNNPNENVFDSYRTQDPELERVPFSQTSQAIVTDSGATLPSTNSDGQSGPITGTRVLQDHVEAATSERSLQLLKPDAPPTPPHAGTHRSLNYHQYSCMYPLSRKGNLHGKIVYPQIVREIFADIDSAIHEWRHI